VAVVLGSADWGGAEHQALLGAQALRAAGSAEIAVFAMTGAPLAGSRVALACAAAGLPCLALPRCESRWGWRTWLRCRAIGRRLRSFRPELLLPSTMPANIACTIGLTASGARAAIWTQRDEGLARFPGWVERAGVRRARRFIANSPGGAGFVSAGLGVPTARVRVVPNAVALAEPRRARASWRAELGIASDAQVACMVANLSAQKDHRTLLAAWPLVVAALAPRVLHLVLAGRDDGLGGALRTQVEAAGLSACVHFAGAVDDVAGLLAASDVAVHSSRSEGLPNAVLEAMASGLAVVASDIPGVRFALGEGPQPLAAPGDPTALAAQLSALLADPRRRSALGAANRQRAQERFSISALVEALAEELDLARAATPHEGRP
jgi:glycosyltransferase involved in cell wall biosynthesis